MADSLQIKNMREKHRHLMREIIADPAQSNKELGMKIGVTPVWVSIVRNSDCFKAMMESLQRDMDLDLTQGISQQLNGLASQALERLHELIPQTNEIEEVVDVMDSALDRLGYGTRGSKTGNSINVYNQRNTQQNHYGSVPPEVLEQLREKMGSKYGDSIPALQTFAESPEGNGGEENEESPAMAQGEESQKGFPSPWGDI